MKYSWMVFILMLFLALAVAAVGAHDEKIAFPATSHHIISLANPYSDRVELLELCVYFYGDTKKDVCQKVTKESPSFFLPPSVRWMQIQRVVLKGKNLTFPDEHLACIAYAGHHPDTLASLEKVGDSTVQVNYVGDHYMVCSLIHNPH